MSQGVGGNVREVNWSVEFARRPGQVAVPTESSSYVSAHGFWKQGTTVVFDIRIVNLDAGSYLCTAPEKSLENEYKDKKGLYIQDFLEHIRYFTPMVYSVDIITGAEALAPHKRLSALLSFKLKRE